MKGFHSEVAKYAKKSSEKCVKTLDMRRNVIYNICIQKNSNIYSKEIHP
jgi:hypothetical protein